MKMVGAEAKEHPPGKRIVPLIHGKQALALSNQQQFQVIMLGKRDLLLDRFSSGPDLGGQQVFGKVIPAVKGRGILEFFHACALPISAR